MQQSLTNPRYVSLHEGDQPVPGFRLVRRRGRGGFGEVWEAEASGGFLVALKFVRLSNRARAAELRALDFVRGIHHPNLLANFGSWLIDDTLVIGMELADRSLLDRHIEATRQGYRGIPRGELLGYLAEVAAGIDHLNDYRHAFDGRTSIGVQHRDLKPPNILLFGGGAKVADLGMARAMEGEVAGHTGIWTFPYAAPEFFRGETTRQSDQYGLAATFCQLRGGRLPFVGSAASVTAGHLFGRPDLEALPEPERPIVERALAKVAGERWPTCRAFVEALRLLPLDAVPDILVDPDGPSSDTLGFLSVGDASSFASEFAMSGSGAMDSEWNWNQEKTGSTFASSFIALPPAADEPSTPSDDHAPDRNDFTPTLVLPIAPSSSPEQAPPAWPRRGRSRAVRGAVASATMLILATVAIHTSNRNPEPRAAEVASGSPRAPDPLVPPLLPMNDLATATASPLDTSANGREDGPRSRAGRVAAGNFQGNNAFRETGAASGSSPDRGANNPGGRFEHAFGPPTSTRLGRGQPARPPPRRSDRDGSPWTRKLCSGRESSSPAALRATCRLDHRPQTQSSAFGLARSGSGPGDRHSARS